MTFKCQWPVRRLLNFMTVLVIALNSGLALSQTQPEVPPKPPSIITYLTETINWYRGTVVEQQIANEPGDITFQEDNRRISNQIVRLAFDFARQEEQRESKQLKANQTPDQANTLSQNQRLIQAVAKADQQVDRSQNELQSLQKQLETAPQKRRPASGVSDRGDPKRAGLSPGSSRRPA